MCTTRKKISSTTCRGISPFLPLVISLLIWLTAATAVTADTYLVANDSDVPVRSGQGTEYKIVALLKKGEPVTSLEETEYWIRIRTATGREGWMLKRYLSSTPSVDDAFALPAQNNQAAQPFPAITPVNEPTQNALPTAANVLAEKTPTLHVENLTPQIEPKLKEQEKEIEELRNKLAAVTQENQELRKNERTEWFLAGGGVLVVGWFLGLISCKARKRKPSLL
jgi:SH3 domain protein